MKERYFENVKAMIEYAKKDIEFWGVFEFQYGTLDNEIYVTIEDITSIKMVDGNTFEFENVVFDLDLLIPCC